MNNAKKALSNRRARCPKGLDGRSSRQGTTALGFLAMLTLAALLIAGCAVQPSGPGSAGDQIVVRAWEETVENDPDGCRVGYDLIYPVDLDPHSFDLYVAIGKEIEPGNPEGALRENGGPLTIPRPDRDHRVDRTDPEANVLRVELQTFSPCVQQQFGERFVATLEFRSDRCLDPHCDALRFELPAAETRARFRATGTGE